MLSIGRSLNESHWLKPLYPLLPFGTHGGFRAWLVIDNYNYILKKPGAWLVINNENPALERGHLLMIISDNKLMNQIMIQKMRAVSRGKLRTNSQ